MAGRHGKVKEPIEKVLLMIAVITYQTIVCLVRDKRVFANSLDLSETWALQSNSNEQHVFLRRIETRNFSIPTNECRVWNLQT